MCVRDPAPCAGVSHPFGGTHESHLQSPCHARRARRARTSTLFGACDRTRRSPNARRAAHAEWYEGDRGQQGPAREQVTALVLWERASQWGALTLEPTMRWIAVVVLSLVVVCGVAVGVARRPNLPPAERGRRLAE